MEKTVYVLGAGFSMSAGAPSQDKIIREIFKLAKKFPDELNSAYVESFKNFLTNTLLIPERLHDQIPLEDVFTPLDKCALDNISFRELSIDKVKKMRREVYFLIGKTLEFLLRDREKKYIDVFANYIVKECSQRSNNNYSKCDPVSIISTNWDILLDTSLQDQIENEYHDKAVVDYCCNISSYDRHDSSVKPGLEVLGKGGFNIKLLKLHGSLNWLQCPRCLRNYVDMNRKIAASQHITNRHCRHCDEHFNVHDSHTLISNLIMPTFLKDFTNPQYKLIWQNAGIELSEAEKIIFIGYSLPQADFEMRQLLARMVRSNAIIEVVDFGKSGRLKNIVDTTKRYEIFFGKRLKKPIYWKGTASYVNQFLGD